MLYVNVANIFVCVYIVQVQRFTADTTEGRD